MSTPLRLFFALWPDAAACAAVVALVRDVAQHTGGRATREQTLHLTLAFIGDVSPERVPLLEALGQSAADAAAPFTLTLGIVGGFRDARVAWLGVEPVPTPLAALAARLGTGLAAEGFRVDHRPFAAHVTLVRRCRTLPSRASVAPIAWRVDRLTLVASELASGGSRYRTLAEWSLGTADSP
jgi:RNA 2',3'-cyclic 3'-phosphodiesterase